MVGTIGTKVVTVVIMAKIVAALMVANGGPMEIKSTGDMIKEVVMKRNGTGIRNMVLKSPMEVMEQNTQLIIMQHTGSRFHYLMF